MGDQQCGKTEGNCNSFATTSNISTSNKFNSTNIILSISRTCLSEDLAHRLLQQDLKTGWAIFLKTTMLTIFEPFLKTTVQENTFFAVQWQRQRIHEYLTLFRIIDKLRNSNHDFDENHWRSEGDTGHHCLILDFIFFFRTQTCCPPSLSSSPPSRSSSSSSELEHAVCHSLLDQRDRCSKSGGGGAGRQVINPFSERWIYLNLSNVPRRKQGTQWRRDPVPVMS